MRIKCTISRVAARTIIAAQYKPGNRTRGGIINRVRIHQARIVTGRLRRLWRQFAGPLRFCVMAMLFLTGPCFAEESLPTYREFAGSFFLPFARGSGFESALSVRVRINGGPIIRLELDTGSTGVVLGQGLVRPVDRSGPPDEFVYSSSGQVHHGVRNDVRIEFVDGRGLGPMRGKAPVVTVPALIVTNVTCQPAPFPDACHAGQVYKRPAMMGIGFGEIDQNALLNFEAMKNGQMRRGYIIEPDGLRIGLTGDDVAPGFFFVKLERPAQPEPRRIWALPAVNLRATLPDGKQYDARGRALTDTGIRGMFLALPGAPTSGLIPPETQVSVAPQWIGGRGPEIRFSLAERRALTPMARGARWVRMAPDSVSGEPMPFINTGLRPLGAYRILYDADGGYWGMMPREPGR